MRHIAFIGAGAMAEAIVSGLISKGIFRPEQIWVNNKENYERLERFRTLYGVRVTRDKREALSGAGLVLLSVKPKDAREALEAIKPYVRSEHIIVSVMAGITTDSIARALGIKIPVVRAMPNTSAAIGQSATAIAAGRYATKDHLSQVERLFKAIGTTAVVSEHELHAVTALSGSGPAYVYYFAEALEAAAKEAGLKPDIARELILQTLAGAVDMLKTSGAETSELRRQVTSPGGTTQAGLEVLEQYKTKEALCACIRRAMVRSAELAEQYETRA
jgi:pyrroline-5-carboxylate reductase